jgi:tetratricopeptide (TPR) repeat protein
MPKSANSQVSVVSNDARSNTVRLWRRIREHRRFRVGLLMSIGAAAALCGEVSVLIYDFRHHRQLVLHVLVWLMVIALLVTGFGIVARTPWGEKHWPRRLVVRPFETLKSHPELNGVALASLMDRQLRGWLSNRFNKSKGAAATGPGPTLSLGWASVPLDWIWGGLKGWVTGRPDISVDGLLIDDERGIVIGAWVSDVATTWSREVAAGSLAESFPNAVEKLAFDLLGELEPKKVALFESFQWRDDDAIRLMTRDDDLSEEELVLLAEIYLSAERLSKAEDVLQGLYRFLKDGTIRLDAKQTEAQLRMKQGRFREARNLLEPILKSQACKAKRRCDWRLLIAEAFAREYCLEDAITHYGHAWDDFCAAADKAMGKKREPSEDILKAVREASEGMIREAQRDELRDLLVTARQVLEERARCWMLMSLATPEMAAAQQSAATLDLLLAIDVHNLWTDFVPIDEAIKDSSAATLWSTLTQNRLAQGDSGGAQEAFEKAIPLWQQALPMFEGALEKDPGDMNARAQLAWCYFGRSSLWRLHSKIHPAEKQRNAESGTEAEDGLVTKRADLTGVQSLGYVIHSLPTAERQIVDDLYGAAIRRESGAQQNLRLWKTAEAIAAWMIGDQGSGVLGFGESFRPDEEPGPEELRQAAMTYTPLLESQKKADMDDDEVRALVSLLSRLLIVFVKQNDAEDKTELSQLWEGAEAEVTARQADLHFELLLRLDGNNRRTRAEAAYGRACLAAILGEVEEAVRLLVGADELACEGTHAYRNRAVLDKDFDGVRLAPEFVRATGWPPQSASDAEIVTENGSKSG